MRLDPAMSLDEVQRTLQAEATVVYGAERLEALEPTIRLTAGALWQVSQQSLAMADEEPDFIGHQPVSRPDY